MRKNLEIDVPKDAETEVQRVRGLKKSIFTRTRIALLSLVLVLALSVATTYAYISWTANQTPNRASAGEIDFSIVETVNGGTEEKVNAGQTDVEYGVGNKQVKLRASDNVDIASQRVRVSFIPVQQREVDKDKGYVADVYMNEEWSAPKTATVTGDDDVETTYTYIECGDIKLYIANNWADDWTYDSGTFTYKKSLEQGQETPYLLLGMESSTNGKGDTEKIHVIAEAIQENTSGTWASVTSGPTEETTS